MTAIATLMAEIGVDTSKLKEGLNNAKNSLGETAGHFASAAGGVLKFGAATAIAAGSAGIGLLSAALVDSINQGISQQRVMAQTEAVLKSTRGASGQTAQSIGDYADQMARLTGISDDTIQASENVLLTFTQIGGKVFPQAQNAILDVATAMHEDLQSATVQVGKALNDPVKGMTALSRIGVTFTAEQKKAVAQMVKTGDVAGAQKLILQELQKEFGGSAEAAGNTFGGQMQRLGVILDQAKEQIGLALIPILSKLVTMFTTQLVPIISKVMAFLMPLIAQFGKALPSALAVVSGFIMGQVVPAAKQMWTWFQTQILPSLISTAEYVQKNVVPILLQLADFIMKNVVPTLEQLTTWFVQKILPALVKLEAWIAAKVIPILEGLWTIFQKNILPVLESVVQQIMTKLVPALQSLWDKISPTLMPVLNALGWVFQNVIGPALNVVISIITTLLGWIGKIIDGFKGFADMIDNVGNKLGGLMQNVKNIPGVGGVLHWAGVPGFADGGVAPGGLAMVGERGPELVDLPAGSRVHNATETAQMLAAASRGMQKKGNTYNVNVYPARASLTSQDLVMELKWQELLHG